MAYEITRGASGKPVRAVVYGPEGVGKTTFAAAWPGAVFIDVEDGSAHYDVARYPKPASWGMLLDEIHQAASDPNVGTLVIDTADAAEALCIESLLEEHKASGIEKVDGGYGKGYTYLAEAFRKLPQALDECVAAGKHVLVLAHAQIKKFEQPDELGAYDRWELKLQKKSSPIIKEWADLLLFANFKVDLMKSEQDKKKVKAAGGKRRVMYASHTAAYDAKNRLGLPDEMPFAFDAVKDALPKIGASPQPQAEVKQAVVETIKELQGKASMENMQADIKFEEVTPPEVFQLLQLMADYQVKDADLMAAVGANPKYQYTAETPLADYPVEFLRNVILPNWEAIVSGIRAQDVPFN